jgi:hypothetical protein
MASMHVIPFTLQIGSCPLKLCDLVSLQFHQPSSSAILAKCDDSLALSSHYFSDSASACERVTNQSKYNNIKI